MRQIERRILDNFRKGKPGRLSERDLIDFYKGRPGKELFDGISDFVSYQLWNSCIASWKDGILILGTMGGRFQSRTTKSRINAFSKEFNLPRIVQKNFIWYWTDGKEYTGERVFNVNI